MSAFWPELLVLALFLTGDLFFNGMAAALAGVAAGVTAFLILLFTGRRKPGLIIEGLIFGGVTALGELISFPGGTVILMEVVLGLILLVSGIVRWDVFSRMAGGMGKGLVNSRQSRMLSLTLGSVFLVHGGIFSMIALEGTARVLVGIVLFLLLYAGAMSLSARWMRKNRTFSVPRLVQEDNGRSVVIFQEEKLGSLVITSKSPGVAELSSIDIGSSPEVLLKHLISTLRDEGYRMVFISSWPGDEIELEMHGFTCAGETWRRAVH